MVSLEPEKIEVALNVQRCVEGEQIINYGGEMRWGDVGQGVQGASTQDAQVPRAEVRWDERWKAACY